MPHFPLTENAGTFGMLHRNHGPAIAETPVDGVMEDGERARTGYVGMSVDAPRLMGALAALLLLLIAITVRAAQLQLVNGSTYRAQAEGNRSRIEWIPAERGVIYDRNGTPLVANVPTFTAAIVPSAMPKGDVDRKEIIATVAETLGIAPLDIEDRLKAFGPTTAVPVPVQEDITHDQSVLLMVLTTRWPAVTVVTGMRRDYKFTDTATSLAHIMGFEGRVSPDDHTHTADAGYAPTDLVGKTGLERQYESAMRGTFGRRRIEVDAGGRQKTVIAEDPAAAGTNLVLSIDLDLQKQAEASLRAHLRAAGKARGSVIVMKPSTGEILAMVSEPSFDNNLFAKGISSAEYQKLNGDPNHPMFARAVSGSLASGSVFKPVVASAALDEGIVTPATTFLSTG